MTVKSFNFIASDTWVIFHNLNTTDVIVVCYDSDQNIIQPESIYIPSAGRVILSFTENKTGTAFITDSVSSTDFETIGEASAPVPIVNLSIDVGSEGTYDTVRSQDACIIKDGDTYKCLYSGSDGSNFRIIYCESPNKFNWSNFQVVFDADIESPADAPNWLYDVQSPSVVNDNGTFKVIYAANDDIGRRLYYAESADMITWTNHQVVLSPGDGGSYDDNMVIGPSVVKVADNVFRLLYAGTGSTPYDYYKVMYAESVDMITWTNHQLAIDKDTEGAYDTNYLKTPTIVDTGSGYRVYYTGTDVSGISRILFAESNDLISYSNHQLAIDIGTEGIYDTVSIFTTAVIYEDSSFDVLYAGWDGTNSRLIMFGIPVGGALPETIVASDAGANDYFGYAVAANSDCSIICGGAFGWDDTQTNQGALYTYDWNGASWDERAILTPGDPQLAGSFGYAAALSNDGLILAVGASNWSGAAGSYQGVVYIYDLVGGAWVERGTLTPSDAAASDIFGASCAFNGDGTILAVGCVQWDDTFGNQGCVYLFDWTGSAWVERAAVVTASDAGLNDNFGHSCSLSNDGSILAVGARNWDGASTTDQGAVYVFDWDGGAWIERTTAMEHSTAQNSTEYFTAVSLNGDGTILAVGAFGWNGSGNNRGCFYIFDWDGISWVDRTVTYEPLDAADGNYFAQDLELSSDGNTLIVGAAEWDGPAGSVQGRLYVYDWTGTAWIERVVVPGGSVPQSIISVDIDSENIITQYYDENNNSITPTDETIDSVSGTIEATFDESFSGKVIIIDFLYFNQLIRGGLAMPALNVQRLVNVTINLSPLSAARRGFGTLLIAGDSSVIRDSNERIRSYTDIESVASDFGLSTPEYEAANLYFSQVPKPSSLIIGRWYAADQPPVLVGGNLSSTEQTLSLWTAITDGSFDIDIDSATQNITGLDFSSATNLNGVADVITAALTGATATWNTNHFEIASTSAIGYASAGAAGTDVSAMLKMTSALSNSIIAFYSAEEPVNAIQACADKSGDWYGSMFAAAASITGDQYQAVAAYIEASSVRRLFGVVETDSSILDASYTTDLATRFKDLSYRRTCVQYSANKYAIASFFGRAFSVNFSANKSTITMMYKGQPGVIAESITETQAQTLKDKRCNIYVSYQNDTAIIQYGVMSGDAYFDEMHGLDWFANALQTSLYNLLYTSLTKVPQTDAGQNELINVASSVCQEAIRNGLVAPGQWNQDGFGQLKRGDFLQEGFYIFTSPMADQDQSTRDERIAPPIQVALKLAGAIHKIDAIVNVNR